MAGDVKEILHRIMDGNKVLKVTGRLEPLKDVFSAPERQRTVTLNLEHNSLNLDEFKELCSSVNFSSDNRVGLNLTPHFITVTVSIKA